MAKISKIVANNKKKELIAKYATRRAELKAKILDDSLTDEERLEAAEALNKLPRNSSPVRFRNRCELTGRPRAFLRKFRLSRIAFRELALQGMIPGVRKSSW